MRKILYIVPHLRTGGPVNQLYDLIKYLDRNKTEASILTLSPEETRSSKKNFEDIQVPVVSLGLTRFQSLFMAKSKVGEHIKHNMLDIIHSQGMRPDILLSSLKFGGRRICTIHNFPQLDYPMTYGTVIGRLMASIHMRALRKFDMCVGVSQAVRNNIMDYYYINNSGIIHNGVDTDIYNKVSLEEKQQFRKQLNLPQKAKIWISSGHLSIRKDPVAIIDAFIEKYRNNMQAVLVFLGSGELETVVKRKICEHKNIILRGVVNNVSDYLKAGDFFVSASHAEGLPISVIEAMACGLPVLLSDIEPHKEIVEMNPAIGKTYLLGSEQSLINAFDCLERVDYKVMSNSAYELVVKELSAKVMSEKYQKIYLD